MTTLAKRFGGIVASIVGLAGIALAGLAIYEIWLTVERLYVEVPRGLDEVDQIVQSIHQQGQSTDALLETTRQHLVAIKIPVQQLASRNQRLSNADILSTLDEAILRRMENIEHFSLSMQNSMRSMSNALLILDSLPFLAQSPAPQTKSPNQWKELAASLAQSADLLEEASRSVSRIRSGQDVAPQQMAQLAEVLDQIDVHLHKVQENIRQFSYTVEQTDRTIGTVKAIAPIWIERGAIVLTVFFVCFGFSQISLLVHGWQLLK
jgi:uncharacterized phage infection (PIP) family protein YhgE